MNERILRALVNELLDQERRALGLDTDQELARHLDVAPKTVSRWRSADALPISTTTLLTLVVRHQARAGDGLPRFGDDHRPADEAAPRRLHFKWLPAPR